MREPDCCPPRPHPDHFKSDSFLLEAGKRYQLYPATCHLLFAEAFVHEGAETDPTYVKLFTSDDPDTEAEDEEQWTLQLAAPHGSSAYTPEILAGLVFHKGLFARIVSDDSTVKVVVNILTVRREHFVTSFPDAQDWLRQSWAAYRESDLYSNFDVGGDYNWSSSGGSGTSSSELGATPVDG